MNKINILKKLILPISILGLLSSNILMPIFNNNINNNKDIYKISAQEEIDIEKTIYIDLSNNIKYLEEDAKPYILDKSNNKINLIKGDNDIYHSEISVSPSNLDKICAYDDLYQIDIEDNDKLNNILYNYIYLDEYIDDDNPISILGYGYYGNKTKNPEPTYKTQRVWLINDNEAFYIDDELEDKCINVIAYIYEDNINLIEMPYVINSFDQRNLYYADIPYEVDNIHFLRMANKKNHNYLIYDDIYMPYIIYGGCYNTSIEDYKNISTLEYYNGADAIILSMVVESYLTYGKNDSNGCTSSTIRNIFRTWFSHKSASNTDLKNQKILDYTGYAANGNSYEGLTKSSYFSVNEKWNTMCSQAGIDPKTGEIRAIDLSWFENSNIKAIIAFGGIVIVVISLAVFFIIYKHKKMDR